MIDAPRLAVLDACVLYPTVLRQILLGCAGQGLFTPLWSARLLEEWRRAAAKKGGPRDEAIAMGEAVSANTAFPQALTPKAAASHDASLWLPDPADIHVLATAIDAGADTIITLNLRDFPTRELSHHGVSSLSPDDALMALWLQHSDTVSEVVARTHKTAEILSGNNLPLRALLKRARLPRLGKALTT